MRAALAGAAVAAALAFGAAHADEVRGPAVVVDGDTIEIDGRRLDLRGIDAPEPEQTCRWPNGEIRCGVTARAALSDLTAGVEVRCAVDAPAADGRATARCVDPHGADVGRNMVWTGWALARRPPAPGYDRAEADARAAKRGLWKGTFEAPWDWRAARR